MIFIKNRYIVCGDETTIVLNSGTYGQRKTTIAIEDLTRAQEFTGSWYPVFNKSTGTFYVEGSIKNDFGIWSSVKFHRWIVYAPENMQIDHENHDTLDNRRSNLRLCSHSENQRNRNVGTRGTSVYKGVWWNTQKKKFLARIRVNNEAVYLGAFKTELDAARAYNQAACMYHGEFAKLNEIK